MAKSRTGNSYLQGRQKLQRFLMCLVLGFGIVASSYGVGAETEDVLVVIPRYEAHYRQLVVSLEKQLKQNSRDRGNPVRLRVIAFQAQDFQANQLASLGANQLVVALGAQATEFTLSLEKNVRIISSFVTRSAINTIVDQEIYTGNRPRLISVLYLEQPVSRIISLLRLVQPDVTSIGSVYGAVSVQNRADLLKQARKYRLEVNDVVLSEQDNPLKKIHPVVENSDALIILPDKSDFNRRVARWIITLSVKHKVPVVGYSSKYSQAGAIVSVYSTAEQIGRHTAELIRQWLTATNPETTQYMYPMYFKISVNNRVAKSLNIAVPDAKDLEKQLLQLESTEKLNQTNTGKTSERPDKL